MTLASQKAHSNHLLSGLPSNERKYFIASCQEVTLEFGHVLSGATDIIDYVYFPTDSFISLIMPVDASSGLEVGMIGNEGMHGILLALGIDIAPFESVVHGAGPALRMEAASFMAAFDKSNALQNQLKRYIYVLMHQLGQAAVCNRFHLVEQRLARWLLMTADRAHSEKFHITQDFLSRMLGVRRGGVTKAAGVLQRQSLISYSRGQMQLHDMDGLQRASCSCYCADKKIYDRMLRH